MVVAANPLAAEAGLAILRKGGSAVDAAIATQMVLNVVEPQSSGIGGGAFLLTWDAASKTLLNFDGRETAPAAATADLFLDSTASRCRAMRRWRADARSASPACSPRSSSRTTNTASCPGPSCSRRPSSSPATASPSPPALPRCWTTYGPASFTPAARAYFFDPPGAPGLTATDCSNPALAATLGAIAERRTFRLL